MNTRRTTTAARILASLAAGGMLLMSVGITLMLTTTSANADAGPKPCTEGTGWIEVNVDATTFTYTAPSGEFISAVCAKGPSAYPVVEIDALEPPVSSYEFDAADYGWRNDNGQVQAISHIGVKLIAASQEVAQLTTAAVTPVQPTCANSNIASYTTSGKHVSFSESAAPAPGASITVTAHPDAGWILINGATSEEFPLDFDAAETPCVQVSAPEQGAPEQGAPEQGAQEQGAQVVEASTTSVASDSVVPVAVNAGIGDVPQDVDVEQGLALALAGAVMVLVAGVLGPLRSAILRSGI
jgi:hypothetical protein